MKRLKANRIRTCSAFSSILTSAAGVFFFLAAPAAFNAAWVLSFKPSETNSNCKLTGLLRNEVLNAFIGSYLFFWIKMTFQ